MKKKVERKEKQTKITIRQLFEKANLDFKYGDEKRFDKNCFYAHVQKKYKLK